MPLPSFIFGIKQSPFLRDFAILGSGSVLAQLIGFAFLPLLTRIFSPESFGEFATIHTFALVLAILASLKLDILIPVVKHEKEALAILKFILVNTVVIVTIGVMSILIYSAIGVSFSPSVSIGFLLSIVALALIIPLASALRYLSIRKRFFPRIAKAQLSRAVSYNLACVGGGLSGLINTANATGLVLGHLAGELVFCFVTVKTLSARQLKYFYKVSFKRMRLVLVEYRKMCATLCGTQLLQVVYGRMPILVIACTYDLAMAGLYAVSERIAVAPVSLISGSIGDVYRQRAASRYNSGKSFRSLLLKIATTISVLALVPVLIGIYLSLNHTSLILGERWDSAGLVLAIMLVSSYFSLIQNPIDSTSIIVGAHKYILYWNLYRLIGVSIASVFAVYGHLGFIQYVAFLAGIRVVASLIDLAAGYHYSNQFRTA